MWGEGSPVKFLAPAHAPATVLPGWLAGQYKDAAKGDLVLVDYKYDDVDPEFTGEDLYSQDFETVEKDSPASLLVTATAGEMNQVSTSPSKLLAENCA